MATDAAEQARRRREGTHAAFKAGQARKPPLFMEGERNVPFDHDDPRHGGVSAYTMGCRCPRCVEAGRHYRAEKKEGRKVPKDWRAP
jgi:hypothetical protein